MIKTLLLATLILALGLSARGQELENGATTFPQPNDTVTGTTFNGTVKINTSGKAINAGTADTTVETFICLLFCGTATGNVGLAKPGSLALCTMDSTIASGAGGDYVINSTATASQCHAQSAAPAAGTWVIGYLPGNSTAINTTAVVFVDGFVFGGSGGTSFPSTVVLSAGATIPATPAANTTYLLSDLSANYTVVGGTKSTISNPNVTFKCLSPDVIIQQITASTDLFFITAGATNPTFELCGLAMPASGTMGVAVDMDPANPVSGITLINVGLNPTSSTATNGGKGWVNISGGSGHRIDAHDPFSDEHVIVVDNTTPSTHNAIDDVKITGDYNCNADLKDCVEVLGNSASLSVTRLDINTTCSSVGSCLFVVQNPSSTAAGMGGTIQGRYQWIAGSSGSAHLVELACGDACNVGPLVLSDGGAGGNHSGKSLLSKSDGYNDVIHDLTLKLGQNNVGPPIVFLDEHGYVLTNFTINGVGAGQTILNPTSGWSTSAPAVKIQVDNTNNISSDGVISNGVIWMPPSSTADGIDSTCTFTGSQCDRLQINNVKVIGQGSTGSCINLTNTGGGGSTSTNNTVDATTCQGFATGLSIGSNVNNTKIGKMNFVSVTNRFSDSGTGTMLTPLTVANVTKTSQVAAITATTLFTPDANAGYRVNVSVNCDNSSAAATVNPTISWTDPSNQAQSQSLTSAATCTALGSGSFGQLAFPFRAKSGTNIQYSVAIANTPTYDVSIVLEQVTTN
jgi:hypothetical protein